MMQGERFAKITEYLQENKTAKLKDIADLNDVSIDTVRRDFEQMETEGLLRKVRGGAVLYNADITTQAVDIRRGVNLYEKEQIASLLGEVIFDGQAIALNSGTTCVEVARFLAQNYKRLTVFTNNLRAVEVLSAAPDFTILVPGGEVDYKEDAIYGDACEKSIEKYNFDVAIFGVQALSLKKGVTDFRITQKGVIHAMLEASRKHIVVADNSKFEKISCCNICNLDKIDMIVTDSPLQGDLEQQYAEKGVAILRP